MMRFHKYQAFAALCLHDSKGDNIGLLIVFFHQPILEHSLDLIRSTMKIFAARTASELESTEALNLIKEQASLLDKTCDAICRIDINHRITFWNKGAEALYGWTTLEACHQTIHQLLKHDVTAFDAAVKELMLHDEWAGEINEHDKDGSLLVIENHLTLLRNYEGKKSIFAIMSDVSQRKLVEEQIRQLGFYDPLTSLPNRRLLLDRLEKALV